ncbi:MAG: hypothetical protein ACH349_01520 [Candidatus Rhabdochlamydia sp.]
MGIYWCAMDEERKEQFEPPKDFSNKTPGIFHPHSPFPNMVMMMNSFGCRFELVNDCDEDRYYDVSYKDITEEVYKKYLDYFPWAKWEIYELEYT